MGLFSSSRACLSSLLLTFLLPWAADAQAKVLVNPELLSAMPEVAHIGETLVLEGRYFGKKRGRVSLGGRNARILSWRNDSIKARVPPGSGTASLTVVNAKGKRSAPTTFTYADGTQPLGGYAGFKLLAQSDLGMRWVDPDFSVFSFAPPWHGLHAQLLARTSERPVILDDQDIELHYSPVINGSVNSSSKTKTDFWEPAAVKFAPLQVGEGLMGLFMPEDAPDSAGPGQWNRMSAYTQLNWDTSSSLFRASGIPILPVDNMGQTNPFPLLRVTAFDKLTRRALAFADVPLPVSADIGCKTCHATGAAASQGAGWSTDSNLEIQARKNILRSHDLKHETDLQSSLPVRCNRCHYSRELDFQNSGPNTTQKSHPTLSAAIHRAHAERMVAASGSPYFNQVLSKQQTPPLPKDQACFQCHPGKSQPLLRGAMIEGATSALGKNPLICQNCHGNLLVLGNASRNPWQDEPHCGACHSGDFLHHRASADPSQMATDGLRLLIGYNPADPAAVPYQPVNRRFAEESDKPYRFSKGHGGIACAGCHGSAHGIWPGNKQRHPLDNLAAQELQGHAGTVTECVACHQAGSLPLNLDGPHGMHVVGDNRWANKQHGEAYENDPTACQACHGLNLRGTILSRTSAERNFAGGEGKRRHIAKGTKIGCYTCHNGPEGGEDEDDDD